MSESKIPLSDGLKRMIVKQVELKDKLAKQELAVCNARKAENESRHAMNVQSTELGKELRKQLGNDFQSGVFVVEGKGYAVRLIGIDAGVCETEIYS